MAGAGTGDVGAVVIPSDAHAAKAAVAQSIANRKNRIDVLLDVVKPDPQRQRVSGGSQSRSDSLPLSLRSIPHAVPIGHTDQMLRRLVEAHSWDDPRGAAARRIPTFSTGRDVPADTTS